MSDFIKLTNQFGNPVWVRPEAISFIAPYNAGAEIVHTGMTLIVSATPDEVYSLIKGEPSTLPT